jgi:hypothetical protein
VEGLCNGSILGGRLLSGGLARDVEGGMAARNLARDGGVLERNTGEVVESAGGGGQPGVPHGEPPSHPPFRELPSRKGYDRHHLVEKRFAPNLGVNPDDIPAAYLTRDEHNVITQRWNDEIGYRNQTSRNIRTDNASPAQIRAAAQRVYHDRSDFLNAVNVWFDTLGVF